MQKLGIMIYHAPSSLLSLVCSFVCTYQKTFKYISFTRWWGPHHHQRDDHCHHYHCSEGGQWEHLFSRRCPLHWWIYGGGKNFLSIVRIVFISLTQNIARYVAVVKTHSMLMKTSVIWANLSCLHFKITFAGPGVRSGHAALPQWELTGRRICWRQNPRPWSFQVQIFIFSHTRQCLLNQ